MDRETRDKFVSSTQDDLTSGNSCWQTPPAIFKRLNEQFGPFDVDLTADAKNHLLPVWLGPGSTHGLHAADALSAPWTSYGQRGYSNPPYGPFVQRMLKKAREEAALGFTTVLLLPMRVTKAFKAHVLTGARKLLFCDSRICFWENGHPRWNGKKLIEGKFVPDVALFDSIIVIYEPGIWTPEVGLWHVPEHTKTVQPIVKVSMGLSENMIVLSKDS